MTCLNSGMGALAPDVAAALMQCPWWLIEGRAGRMAGDPFEVYRLSFGPSNRKGMMLQRNSDAVRIQAGGGAAGGSPIVVRTSNSSGKKVSSSACLRKPTPLDPPVPFLKPMIRITVRMWRKRHS